MIEEIAKNEEQTSDTPEETSLISLDDTWNTYTNTQYGFAMNIPKMMYHNNGAVCDVEDGKPVATGDMVPVKVFERGMGIYVSSEYFYNPSRLSNQCPKIENSYDVLVSDVHQYRQQLWNIVVREVKNEDELLAFIRDRHGRSCEIGGKEPLKIEGTFFVEVQGDETALDPLQSECILNYATAMFYDSKRGIAITWDLGQAASFPMNEQYEGSYDNAMLESFRFLER